MTILKLAVAFLFCISLSYAEDRIWIEATINGRPAHLYFDTGACGITLNPKGASRLGLGFIPPANGVLATNISRATSGITEECDFKFGDKKIRDSFLVVERPNTLNITEDGSVGWLPIADQILKIDASLSTVSIVPDLPKEIATWTKFNVSSSNCIVGLEIRGTNGTVSIIDVDTGSPSGVMLIPQNWHEWRRVHKHQPATLNAYYTLGTGLIIAEEVWAKEFSFGSLILNGVPLMEDNSVNVSLGGSNYQGTFGLAALKRLDFILDGKNRIAYLRPKKTPPVAYEHNYLGAVFTPSDLVYLQGDDLVAHVVEGSPAFKAGIRNGDVLLKYDEIDVTQWRTQPMVIPSFRMAGGQTQAELTLKRGEKVLKVHVTLRPILSPD